MQGKNYKGKRLSRLNKHKQLCKESLPVIPDKRYFTISEACYLCGLKKAYVLRYWEQEFSQLRPIKRQGNRRFYQMQDILLIRKIRKLLYEKGFTIEGARSQLSATQEAAPVGQSVKTDAIVKKIIAELEGLVQNLRATKKINHPLMKGD